ncbi:hypothetical protein MTO96_035855 [Rhipicephalus appendiculatus]
MLYPSTGLVSVVLVAGETSLVHEEALLCYAGVLSGLESISSKLTPGSWPFGRLPGRCSPRERPRELERLRDWERSFDLEPLLERERPPGVGPPILSLCRLDALGPDDWELLFVLEVWTPGH